MKVVKQKLSRYHTHNHLIFFIPDDPSTFANSILLNNYYHKLDQEYIEEFDWRYYFITKRTFLRHRRVDGKWICHYCGREIFKMPVRGLNKQNVKNCVSVDHKIPISAGGALTDSKNMIVSCFDCNNDI